MGQPNKAWSFSALNSYETCPKKHYLTRIAKTVTEEEGEALVYGKQVHKALELRVGRGTPLPIFLRHLEGICKSFSEATGEISAESRLALNKSFEPVAFFADDVWVRCVLDLTIVNGHKAVIVDWKTGLRISSDYTQLRLAAAILQQHCGGTLKEVTVAYVYTQAGKIVSEDFTREGISGIWNEMLPRVTRFESALSGTDFPARPNGLCRRYCPVRECPHHGVG